jgi:hypothetical protein
MPVTIKKKPIAAKAEPTPESFVQAVNAKPVFTLVPNTVSPDELVDELAEEIDALGELQAEVAKAKELIDGYNKRFSIVREKLIEQGVLVQGGVSYVANVKEKGNKVRTVKDMPLAVKYLGVETFLQVAKIGMADVDKYLTPAQQEEVIQVSESKTRSMTITKKS